MTKRIKDILAGLIIWFFGGAVFGSVAIGSVNKTTAFCLGLISTAFLASLLWAAIHFINRANGDSK